MGLYRAALIPLTLQRYALARLVQVLALVPTDTRANSRVSSAALTWLNVYKERRYMRVGDVWCSLLAVSCNARQSWGSDMVDFIGQFQSRAGQLETE